MSVINRMLRDLDKRQQQERKTTSTPAAAAPKPFPWGWVLGAAVITAIAVTAVMVVWQTTSSQSQESQVEQVSQVEQEAKPPKASANEVEPIVEETPEPSPPVAQATQPQQRLQPSPVQTVSEEASEATEASQAVETTDEPTSAAAETQPEAVVAATSDDEDKKGTMQVERVELSAEELAEVKLKQAREAMRKGERERAGSLFEQVIALAPEHVAARSELAAYWYGRGQIASALAVLEQGLKTQPQQARWQLLYAKILLEGGAYEQTLTALAQIAPDTAQAVDLYQLRAAAANELGRYAMAAADYVTLAERTNEGRWWLAAAVAFEDTQQEAAAARAYRQAIARNDLTSDARSYAQQRLQILGDF